MFCGGVEVQSNSGKSQVRELLFKANLLNVSWQIPQKSIRTAMRAGSSPICGRCLPGDHWDVQAENPWSDPCSWGLASCPQMSQQSRSWSSWWWTPVSSSTTPRCSYLTRLRRGIPRPWSTGMFDLHACHLRPFAQCVICVYGLVGCMLTSSTWNVSPLEAMWSSFWQSSNC